MGVRATHPRQESSHIGLAVSRLGLGATAGQPPERRAQAREAEVVGRGAVARTRGQVCGIGPGKAAAVRLPGQRSGGASAHREHLLGEVAARLGATVDALALAAVLAQP
jgi:hypothetical protein